MGLNHAGFDSDFYDNALPPCQVRRGYGRPLYVPTLLCIFAVLGVALVVMLVVVMPVVVLVLVAWWGWDQWRMRCER